MAARDACATKVMINRGTGVINSWYICPRPQKQLWIYFVLRAVPFLEVTWDIFLQWNNIDRWQQPACQKGLKLTAPQQIK